MHIAQRMSNILPDGRTDGRTEESDKNLPSLTNRVKASGAGFLGENTELVDWGIVVVVVVAIINRGNDVVIQIVGDVSTINATALSTCDDRRRSLDRRRRGFDKEIGGG